MALYNFIKRMLPGPGSGNAAFIPGYSLPMQSIQGPGFFTRGQLATFQPAQMVHLQRRTEIGLIGVQAGTMATQPLYTGDEEGNM